MTMQRSVRSIQFLRFVAAALVVYSHAMDDSKDYILDTASPFMHYVADFGRSGVHIFFVISGFIMVYTTVGSPAEPFHPSTFLAKRFIRIYPTYWIYAATYIFFREMTSSGYPGSIFDLCGSLLLLPAHSALIIGQGWTLSYELYFYGCFAFFMNFSAPKGLIAMTVFFLASAAIGSAAHFISPALHLVTNSLLIEFALGAWIAYAYVSGAKPGVVFSNILILFGLGLLLTGVLAGYDRLPSVLMWGVPSALLIAGCVFTERHGRLPSFVRNWAFFGDSSYSLYLAHILLIAAILKGAGPIFPDLGYFYTAVSLVLVILCVLIAHIFYMLIERRMLRYFHNATNSWRESQVLPGVS